MCFGNGVAWVFITVGVVVSSGGLMYYRRRVCAYCGREFYAAAPGQRYCSPECRERAQRERRREYRRRRVERGRGYSPKPRFGDRCVRCGFDVVYALEYSHEVNGFLCANCHRLLHQGSERRMRDARRGYPVRLFGALYDPGFPYEPERCYLCRQPITPTIWEEHHMIPRRASGDNVGVENIVIVCANCHRILTRASSVIEKYFAKFLNSDWNPYYPHYKTPDQYKRLSIAVKVKIIRGFYAFLREKWEEIMSQLRQISRNSVNRPSK